jgi:23S rRNA pseudouridine2605 synthase
LRLQQYLARAGVASRRAAEELITAGEIKVNGSVVTRLGVRVEPGDRVEYRDRVVVTVRDFTTLVLHKPGGVVTTMRDPQHRTTVARLVQEAEIGTRVVPVGRLDYETSGVLLLTDDGDLAHALTHPRFGVSKTYRATVRGRIGPDELGPLRAGIRLETGTTAPARVRVVAARRDRSIVDVTLHEGRNRQVRRMFDAVGHPVIKLVRTHFGPIALGSLQPGRLRPPTTREARDLRAIKDAAAEASR